MCVCLLVSAKSNIIYNSFRFRISGVLPYKFNKEKLKIKYNINILMLVIIIIFNIVL